MTCPTSYGLFVTEQGWKAELEGLASQHNRDCFTQRGGPLQAPCAVGLLLYIAESQTGESEPLSQGRPICRWERGSIIRGREVRGVTDEKNGGKNQLRTGKVDLRTTFQLQQGGGREGRWSRDKEKGFLYLSNPKCSPKCNPKCSKRYE